MAYANGAVKVVITGALVGVQSWSTGIEFQMASFGGALPHAELQTWLENSVTPAVETWFTAIQNLRSNQCTWTSTRASVYTPTGIAQAAEAPAGANTQGSIGILAGPRAALVVSKITGVPQRHARGRMYIPGLSASLVATTGRVVASQITTTLNATKALYNAIAATTLQEQALTPVVLSPTTGLATPMTSLRIDDLLDTQMRREDKFQPVYQTIDL